MATLIDQVVALRDAIAAQAKATAGAAVAFTTTNPSFPSWGKGRFFARQRGRVSPAFINDRGFDSILQDHWATNKIVYISAHPNQTLFTAIGTTPVIVSGGGTTPTAVTSTSSNYFTRAVRFRLATAATAGSVASIRSTGVAFSLSAVPNAGGFDLKFRFGVATFQTAARVFVGLTSTVTPVGIGTAEPSTLLNSIGVCMDSTDNTMYFMTNDGTGNATKVNTGLGSRSNQTTFFELTMFAVSGDANRVDWCLRVLNDGTQATGTSLTDLPVAETMLTYQAAMSNGTAAAVANLDIQTMYVLTDN